MRATPSITRSISTGGPWFSSTAAKASTSSFRLATGSTRNVAPAAGRAVNDPSDAANEIRRQVVGQDQAGAVAWAELDLWCMSAAGLLDYFAEARALFRYLGGSVEGLRPLAEVRQGPAEVVRAGCGFRELRHSSRMRWRSSSVTAVMHSCVGRFEPTR